MGVLGEIKMIAEVKRKPDKADSARKERERARQENALDQALKDNFPASDPASVDSRTARRRPRQGKDLKRVEVSLRAAVEASPSIVRILVASPASVDGANHAGCEAVAIGPRASF